MFSLEIHGLNCYSGIVCWVHRIFVGGQRSRFNLDIESETKEIQRFIQEGNYHAAYNIALSGLNACRRNNDQAGIDQFINIIKGVVDSLAAEFGSQSN